MIAQPRIELWDIEDVPADVVAAAAAAVLEKLDEIGVSPLEARLAMSNIEVMDDGGGLYGVDEAGNDIPPDYVKWGVNLAHLDAYNAVTDVGGAVIKQLFPSRENGSIAIGVPLPVFDHWDATGADLTKAS